MENNKPGNNGVEAPPAETDNKDTGTAKKKSKDIGHYIFSASESRSVPKDAAGRREQTIRPPLFPETKTSGNRAETESAEPKLEAMEPDEIKRAIRETAQFDLAELQQTAATQQGQEAAVDYLHDVALDGDADRLFVEHAARYDMTYEEVRAVLEHDGEINSEAVDSESDDGAESETVVDSEALPEPDDAAETDNTEGEVDLDGGSAAIPMGPTGRPRPAASSAGGGPGSGGAPPVPPSGAPSAGGPSPVGRPSRGGPAPSPAVTAPGTFNPHTAATRSAESPESNRAKAGQLLVVGIVGYLIGRRRGRIRTEKKLLPVQHELEKQVRGLQEDLRFKEQALMAAKVRQAQVSVERPTHPSRQEVRQVLAVERTQPGLRETRIGMQKPRAEHLGHLVIAAEAPKTVQRPTAERPVSLSAIKPESVKDMRRSELLEVSEKIIIEGASLRKIYESGLVGERQLRHLVSEHLQGKDIRKNLRQEMVEHEIDFERDPLLRDRVRSHLKNGDGGSGGLDALLASAGIINVDDSSVDDTQSDSEQVRKAAVSKNHGQKRVLADSAMVTAIVVLAIIVFLLLMRG